MERKLLDMMNQLSISEYNPRTEYCDKFRFYQIRDSKLLLRLDLETQSGHFYVTKMDAWSA